MLSHILHQVQRFERSHGVRPNVVYVNREHYAALRENYPQIFRQDPEIALGFRIAVVSSIAIQPAERRRRPTPPHHL